MIKRSLNDLFNFIFLSIMYSITLISIRVSNIYDLFSFLIINLLDYYLKINFVHYSFNINPQEKDFFHL